MLLESNKSIPQVYGKERTIQVFTGLLDDILNCVKFDIDNLGSIYDAYTCPEIFLPLLAKTLNYQYNFNDTVSANRRIIKVFADLEKMRGSQKGLTIATALSLSSDMISTDFYELDQDVMSESYSYMKALKTIDIRYDYENAVITIRYNNYYQVIRNLLEYVRPVGMWVKLISEKGININSDAMLIYADTENIIREYNPELDSFVSRTFVNFSTTGDPTFKQQLEEFMESVGIENDTIDLNGGD